MALGTGEAVVSMLQEDGTPSIANIVSILPPRSALGSIDDAERDRAVKGAMLYSKYEKAIDPDSAYEFLERMGLEAQAAAEKEKADALAAKEKAKADALAAKEKEKAEKAAAAQKKRVAKSVGNSVAGTVGREVGKSVGSSFGKFGKTLGGNVGASLGRGLLSTLFKL
jgi:membrane protein involved in colicin uptake